ncbi:DUF3857 domain-containing protein [Portibacter lacus]|uniref:DUF3857 domain-containing protein n=1 Tax=Portibacter lacus TaxID=1099794 RepID=A0AA37WFI2_9BACT|nr:DUF3857 domain-containing protein [Portibacter lacus]GLR20021.1 hypothetical protein GCM10007940_46370 [Portibacter lacus]
MKNIFCLILFLFSGSLSHAQIKFVEFGKLKAEEIELKAYKTDLTADAVVLYDKGEVHFLSTENGFKVQFTRHKRIKIFNKSALKYAEISLPYYVENLDKSERIDTIEGFTYTLKGDQYISKKLDSANIYDQQVSDNVRSKKFVFPDVQEGSIIEYKYVLESPFYFSLPEWRFQDRIPTLYSEFQISMIPFYEYELFAQGISGFDFQNSYVSPKKRKWFSLNRSIGTGFEFQENVHIYILKDIPAFEDDSYITSINDYIIRMNFQLSKIREPSGISKDIISTWPDLNEALLKNEHFGIYLKNCGRIAKNILKTELQLEDADDIDKAKAIIEYVKKNYKWNGSNSKFASQPPKDFHKLKSGNVADINLFLIALLNEAKIEAVPVILSTRDHGKIPYDYPFDHFTNYVVALVTTGNAFLADASEEQLRFNVLPMRSLNENGLIVNKKDEPKWISLNSNTSSLEKKTLILNIDSSSMDIKATVSIQCTNYEAFYKRDAFKDEISDINEYYKDRIGEVLKTKTSGYESDATTYSMNFLSKFETEKFDGHIIIKPFLNLAPSSNLLKLNERTYPVDFTYIMNKEFDSKFQIPDGYKLADLPENIVINDDLAEINLRYELKNHILSATGNYNLKKAIYEPDEYGKLKQYLDLVVSSFGQVVVLEVE